ncbi:MAG TPA: hypothetical protein VMD53_01845 [Rhizomicrobium sp.]|nr:hypothetical protein [Rhizomicrobium sp.]
MTSQRASLWQRLLNTWRHNRRKRGYAIDIVPDGFVFRAKQRRTEMKWDQITRIDAGVRCCLTFDYLYVQMFTHQATVYIEELDDGFRQFEYSMFERWPAIRARWDELLKGALHVPKHETLWRPGG